jgi:HAMP domain-containing protein
LFPLVAVGVTGEFVGNWIAGPIRKRLEAAKELEIARLNKEVAETSS